MDQKIKKIISFISNFLIFGSLILVASIYAYVFCMTLLSSNNGMLWVIFLYFMIYGGVAMSIGLIIRFVNRFINKEQKILDYILLIVGLFVIGLYFYPNVRAKIWRMELEKRRSEMVKMMEIIPSQKCIGKFVFPTKEDKLHIGSDKNIEWVMPLDNIWDWNIRAWEEYNYDYSVFSRNAKFYAEIEILKDGEKIGYVDNGNYHYPKAFWNNRTIKKFFINKDGIKELETDFDKHIVPGKYKLRINYIVLDKMTQFQGCPRKGSIESDILEFVE